MAHPKKKRLSDNPVTVASIVGAGTLAATALAVVLTEQPTGDVVASGPEVEEVEMVSGDAAEVDASDAPEVETSGENVTPEDTADEVVPTVATDLTAEDLGAEQAPIAQVEDVNDGEDPALRGASTDDDPVSDLAPINVADDGESEAIDPEQADMSEASDASGADEPSAAATEADASNESGLDLDLVVDNDGGEANEPDGGAAPFVPTPSGPEGRDGDPFTTE